MGVTTAVFAIPTDDPPYAAWARAYAQQQISFYLSTPAYRIVAEMHGWQATAHELSLMARSNQWAAMPSLITDDMLDIIAVSGAWAGTAHPHSPEIWFPLLDRVSYYLPFIPTENQAGWQATIKSFSQIVL
ncbi:MAG: hypothetical protein M5U34_49060 [Chloroflexi bacterium]|nr:hypothetical protein [Chloroflexota bacterium]